MKKERWVEASKEIIPVLEEAKRICDEYGIKGLHMAILSTDGERYKSAFCIEPGVHYSVSSDGESYTARMSTEHGTAEYIEMEGDG